MYSRNRTDDYIRSGAISAYKLLQEVERRIIQHLLNLRIN